MYALGVGRSFHGSAFLMGAVLSLAGTLLMLNVLRGIPGTGRGEASGRTVS